MSDNIRLRVWQCLSNSTPLEDAFPNADADTHAVVRQTSLDLWMRFNDKKLHLQDTYNRLSAAAADRSEFEQLAASHPDHEVLLTMGLGAEIDEAVWERVRPE